MTTFLKMPPLFQWTALDEDSDTYVMRVIGGWLVTQGDTMCHVPNPSAFQGAWGEAPELHDALKKNISAVDEPR